MSIRCADKCHQFSCDFPDGTRKREEQVEVPILLDITPLCCKNVEVSTHFQASCWLAVLLFNIMHSRELLLDRSVFSIHCMESWCTPVSLMLLKVVTTPPT